MLFLSYLKKIIMFYSIWEFEKFSFTELFEFSLFSESLPEIFFSYCFFHLYFFGIRDKFFEIMVYKGEGRYEL